MKFNLIYSCEFYSDTRWRTNLKSSAIIPEETRITQDKLLILVKVFFHQLPEQCLGDLFVFLID